MSSNRSAEDDGFAGRDTRIEIVFRSYGCEEDLKSEELAEAFGRVGKLQLSPRTPPKAGSLYDLSIILTFVGTILAGELVKAGGRRIYESLREGYRTLTEVPKLRDKYLRPSLTIQYDNIVLVLGNLTKADFEALPQLFEAVTAHLSSPPLIAWNVRSILFNIERDMIGSWNYNDYPMVERTEAGLGRYWGLVATLGASATPEQYTHAYDSTERTIVELDQHCLGPPPRAK